jgi:hypothetical protein
MAKALATDEHFDGETLLSSRTLWEIDKRRAFRGRSEWGG